MSANMRGSPSDRWVAVAKPPAAIVFASRQPRFVAATRMIEVEATYGRWLTAATSPSCSSGSTKYGVEPIASTILTIFPTASLAADDGGVMQYTAFWNSSAAAPP